MQTPLASDLSQQVLELRRLRHELGPQVLDSLNRRLYQVEGYRPFVADVDEFAGNTAQPAIVGTRDAREQ